MNTHRHLAVATEQAISLKAQMREVVRFRDLVADRSLDTHLFEDGSVTLGDSITTGLLQQTD